WFSCTSEIPPFFPSPPVQPTVKISPTKAEPLSHHTLLICTAAGYYPSEIKIKWLKNGQEQTEGVGYSDALQNGDWTFQNQVMLETVPERGDVYACQVEHSSREEPITVQWEPETSDSAKSKVWTGVVGAVLGLVFVAVGLFLYLKSGKSARFLHQGKLECRFANGTRGQVRYLQRYIYDRQEFARFDSRRGTYEAVTELGRPDAAYLNSQKEVLDYLRGEVDRLCRHNYAVLEPGPAIGRKVQPTVKISPTKAEPLSHHSLLICTAAGYYPSEIKIKWLKNGQEQTEGVGYSEELQNGDWTFQNQVMLETVPERGDIYACQVEHSSREEPITVQWEPQTSDSAKSKVWTGVVGAVLGLVFVAVGLALYLKSGKATPLPPATALIS
ncbi:H-2 class II histocompatibility antigen, E-S beta chain-like, partial [Eublepharis macularius]|uniref:H-2 class II histocompatibility antigen, E-S beta chain-like n=1 Tax=Eublepharis macularius TaxID=481883 RepID=A0AA97KXF9_EUBMA